MEIRFPLQQLEQTLALRAHTGTVPLLVCPQIPQREPKVRATSFLTNPLNRGLSSISRRTWPLLGRRGRLEYLRWKSGIRTTPTCLSQA